MRTPLKSIAKAALSRQLSILLILIIGAIGVQTITSCSSGDEPGDNNGSSPSNGNNSSSSGAGNGGGGGANLSDLPKQVYLVDFDDKGDNIVNKEPYGGSSDITFRIPKYVSSNCKDGIAGIAASCTCTDYNGVKHECGMDESERYESKSAGRIQNGQVSLNLPDIDSKYLQDFQSFWGCEDDEIDRVCEASYPENLAMFANEWFTVNISGKSCYLSLSSSGEEARGLLLYSSKPGEITGRFCTGSSDGVCMQYRNFDDLNFSKDWNVVYYLSSGKNSNSTYTSNLSKTGGTVEWWIGGCEGL